MRASTEVRLPTRATFDSKPCLVDRPGSSKNCAQKLAHSRSFCMEMSTSAPSAVAKAP